MKFSSEVFMAAVLGIFRSRKVMAAGGDVPLRVLREDWSGVGLRAGDLAAGLEALVRSGVVIAVTTSSGLSFTLTPNGEDEIRLRRRRRSDQPGRRRDGEAKVERHY